MAIFNGRLYYIAGALQTLGQSRLMSAPIVGSGTSVTLGTPVEVTAAVGPSTESSDLVFPFGLVADSNSLYISAGCNPASAAIGNGKIIKVSNLNAAGSQGTFTNLTAGITPPPTNPAFMFIHDSRLYWSQYSASAGEIWRIPTAGGVAQRLADGLNLPAGIATDGVNIVIANSGLNQILRMPLAGGTRTGINTPDPGDIFRPFDVEYDGVSGFFITQGMALAEADSVTSGLPILYLPQGSGTNALAAVNSVIRGAEIESVNLGGGKVGLVYAEGTASEGRFMKAVVDVPVTSAVSSSQISSSINLVPFGVVVLSDTTPTFLTSVNLFLPGVNQGRIDLYRP